MRWRSGTSVVGTAKWRDVVQPPALAAQASAARMAAAHSSARSSGVSDVYTSGVAPKCACACASRVSASVQLAPAGICTDFQLVSAAVKPAELPAAAEAAGAGVAAAGVVSPWGGKAASKMPPSRSSVG